MSLRGTQVKLRHYRPDPEGRGLSLVWAQDGEHRHESFHPGEILKGSRAELEIIRSQLWTPNALMDEGEKDILDVYFDDVAVRGSLYFRLYSDGAIAETDTLATLTGEVSGTGYTAPTLTRGTDWSDPALDSGDMMTTSATKTFTAGGTWSAADELVLATVASGTAGLALAWVALSTTRTLVNGDTLDVDLSVKAA